MGDVRVVVATDAPIWNGALSPPVATAVNAVKAAEEAAVLTLASFSLALVLSSALTSAMAVRWLSALDPWEYAWLMCWSCASLFPAFSAISSADLSVACLAMPAAIVAVAFSLSATR